MTNYFPNQYIYLLDNDNAVFPEKLEDYIKHFFTDFVTYEGAELVDITVVGKGEISIRYQMPSENCSNCEEKGVTEGLCPDDWYENVEYKVRDLWG